MNRYNDKFSAAKFNKILDLLAYHEATIVMNELYRRFQDYVDKNFSECETIVRSRVNILLNSIDREVFSLQDRDCFSSTVRLYVDEDSGDYVCGVSVSVIPPSDDTQFDISEVSSKIKEGFINSGFYLITGTLAVNGEVVSFVKEPQW